MKGLLFKISMFITSLIPLWLSVIAIDLISILDNSTNLITEYISIAFILIANIFSSIYITKKFKWASKNPDQPQVIISATKENSINTEYLLSCILPLLAFDFTQWRQVLIFSIMLLLLCYLCVRNSFVHANILFELNGYKYYSVRSQDINDNEIESIIISKENLAAGINRSIKTISLGLPYLLHITPIE